MDHIQIKFESYKVIVIDNRQENNSVRHEFVNGDNEHAYLGPMDICPKDIAEILEKETGNPVK